MTNEEQITCADCGKTATGRAQAGWMGIPYVENDEINWDLPELWYCRECQETNVTFGMY